MKLKKVTQNDPIERLAVSIKSSTSKLLERYRDHYFATYGEPIEKSHLVEQVLREFMNSDKEFQKFLAQDSEDAADSKKDAAPKSDDADSSAMG